MTPAAVELGQYQWLLQILPFTTPPGSTFESAMGGNRPGTRALTTGSCDPGTDRDTVRLVRAAQGFGWAPI
jgi:hypothetical protein